MPDGYEVYSAWAGDGYVGNNDTVVDPQADIAKVWPKASGRLTRTVLVMEVTAYASEMIIWVTLKPQVSCRPGRCAPGRRCAIAAKSRYEDHRALVKERLAKLQEELGGQDPLSLRKIEREEVMKGVLRWLFGPSFTFVPPGLPGDLYGYDEAGEIQLGVGTRSGAWRNHQVPAPCDRVGEHDVFPVSLLLVAHLALGPQEIPRSSRFPASGISEKPGRLASS